MFGITRGQFLGEAAQFIQELLELDDVERAVAAGARFLVSPVVDEFVIHAARDLDVACMPGTHTPTEMLRAHHAGA